MASGYPSRLDQTLFKLGEYIVLDVLGEGHFGAVTRCFHPQTLEIVAVKTLKNASSSLENEVEILEELRLLQPDKYNIVRFIEYFAEQDSECMVFETLDRSLFDFMNMRGKLLSLCELRPVVQQLLVAFDGLKTAGIIHADLKPDNIMLVNHSKQPFKVKLIDFGLAGYADMMDFLNIWQPFPYRAPEATLGCDVTEAVDMWSLGCTLAECFTGYRLFSGHSAYENLRTIVELVGLPSAKVLQKAHMALDYFTSPSGDFTQWRLQTLDEYYGRQREDMPMVSDCLAGIFSSLDSVFQGSHTRTGDPEHRDRLAFADLIKRLLDLDDEMRITPKEALHHPFVTMEHLIGDDSEYSENARGLMALALKGSTTVSDLSPPEQPSPHVPQHVPEPLWDEEEAIRPTQTLEHIDNTKCFNQGILETPMDNEENMQPVKYVNGFFYFGLEDPVWNEPLNVGETSVPQIPQCLNPAILEQQGTATELTEANMSKNWCDYTSEDDELLYSQEFDLEMELANQDQTSGPSEEVVQTSVTLEELEREQLEPQTQQRSEEEEDQSLSLNMLEFEKASKAAQALDAREERLLQELEDLRYVREIDHKQHQEEKLKLLNKTELIIAGHKKQLQGFKSELHTVKKENRQLVRESEELKRRIKIKDGDVNQLVEQHEEDKRKMKRIIQDHNTEMKKKDRITQELQIELNNVKEERAALIHQSDELKHQLQSKDRTMDALQKQVAEMKDMLEQIRKDSRQKSKQWEKEKRNLQTDAANMKSKLHKKSSENTELTEQNSQLKRALADFRTDMSALKHELETKKQEAAVQKVQMLRQMEDKDTHIRKMDEEKDATLRTCEEVKEDLRKTQKERSLLMERCSASDQQLKRAEVERSLLVIKNNVLQQQIEEEKQIKTELEEEKTALLKTCEELKAESSLQAESCSALEKQLRSTEEQHSLLEKMSITLEHELEKRKRKWYRRLFRV
ncbi:interaptin-like [Periophthalmus magnuspinnatus]|uniref:interaptin-like n=1 Tax=Periophthalmus magnuspinnatus TaxID=409849 RepID=UPI00243701C9|nr:interaptin-like [Periophthalmus magnuspinnatus]